MYSSLSPDSATLGTSIGDRPHFQAHTWRRKSALHQPPHTGPGVGAVVGASVLPYQPRQPLWRRGGAFHQPDYLSNNLRDVFTQGNDAALLLRADGAYLRAIPRPNEVMALNVPADREFMRYPERTSGRYQVAAPLKMHRFYAWQRLAHYPLVVSVGLSRDQAMAEHTNPCATAACAMPWERWRLCWRRAGLRCSSNVKSRTMNGWSAKGNVTDWHWKAASWAHGIGARLREISFDRRWVRLLGLPKQPTTPTLSSSSVDPP